MAYLFSEVDPSDYYTATTSYFTSDFSSIARFVILDGDKLTNDPNDGSQLDLDLLVNSVTCSFSEHNRIMPYLGDFYNIHFYGRAPLVAQINGTLVDAVGNYNKAYLISLYKNTLRLKAVARSEICPCLIFPGCTLQGPLAGMNIDESSDSPDVLNVSMRMIVMRMLAVSENNAGITKALYDFTGLTSPDSAIITSEADQEYTLISDVPVNYEVV